MNRNLLLLILSFAPAVFARPQKTDISKIRLDHCEQQLKSSLETINLTSVYHPTSFHFGPEALKSWAAVAVAAPAFAAGAVVGNKLDKASAAVRTPDDFEIDTRTPRQIMLENKVGIAAVDNRDLLVVAHDNNFRISNQLVGDVLDSPGGAKFRSLGPQLVNFSLNSYDYFELEFSNSMNEVQAKKMARAEVLEMLNLDAPQNRVISDQELERFLNNRKIQKARTAMRNGHMSRVAINKWDGNPQNKQYLRMLGHPAATPEPPPKAVVRNTTNSHKKGRGFAMAGSALGGFGGAVAGSHAGAALYKSKCGFHDDIHNHISYAPQFNLTRGCHLPEPALETLLKSPRARKQLCQFDARAAEYIQKIVENHTLARTQLPKPEQVDQIVCDSSRMQVVVRSQSGVDYGIHISKQADHLLAEVKMVPQKDQPKIRLSLSGSNPSFTTSVHLDRTRSQRFDTVLRNQRGLVTGGAVTEFSTTQLLNGYLDNRHKLAKLDPVVAGQVAAGEALSLVNYAASMAGPMCFQAQPAAQDQIDPSDV